MSMVGEGEPTANSPAVSVIIATCDRQPFLLDCVASILRNDYQDFEIIIVDQARERTLRAALDQRFNGEGRLVYVTLDEANASLARNLGIERARGDILVFSDDDVEVESGWLSAYIAAFNACAAVPVVVGGRLDPLWLGPRPRWLPEEKEYLLGIYNKHDGLSLMPEADLPIAANFAVHRKVVDAVGSFDARIGPSYAHKRMIFGEESLFSLRARRARYPVYYQGAARSWHKMLPHKISKRWFIRRSFWEGVTLLTVLHLAGSIPAKQCYPVLQLHAREIVRGGRRLAKTLVCWTQLANPAQQAMEAISTIVLSMGVIRAALELRAMGRLPGVPPAEAEAAHHEQVGSLNARLAEAETDRAARLVQIETLTGWLREAEADRAARLVQIETLTGWLRESEAARDAHATEAARLRERLDAIERSWVGRAHRLLGGRKKRSGA
jgi:glucosyl-dolichyl phosphate glucuronosyltransferase